MAISTATAPRTASGEVSSELLGNRSWTNATVLKPALSSSTPPRTTGRARWNTPPRSTAAGTTSAPDESFMATDTPARKEQSFFPLGEAPEGGVPVRKRGRQSGAPAGLGGPDKVAFIRIGRMYFGPAWSAGTEAWDGQWLAGEPGRGPDYHGHPCRIDSWETARTGGRIEGYLASGTCAWGRPSVRWHPRKVPWVKPGCVGRQLTVAWADG